MALYTKVREFFHCIGILRDKKCQRLQTKNLTVYWFSNVVYFQNLPTSILFYPDRQISNFPILNGNSIKFSPFYVNLKSDSVKLSKSAVFKDLSFCSSSMLSKTNYWVSAIKTPIDSCYFLEIFSKTHMLFCPLIGQQRQTSDIFW